MSHPQALLNKAARLAERRAQAGENRTRVGKANLRQSFGLPQVAWANCNKKYGHDTVRTPEWREWATRHNPELRMHKVPDRVSVGYRGAPRGPTESVAIRFGKGRTVAVIRDGKFQRVAE